jgi:hypothetical protein
MLLENCNTTKINKKKKIEVLKAREEKERKDPSFVTLTE